MFAYIDPGTTGLIAQFAAAGFAGVLLYFRSRFSKGKGTEESAPAEESVDEQS